MFQLNRSDYPNLRRLAPQPHLALALDAIAAGNSPALAWADDRTQPGAAYLWDKTHCHFLIGDPDRPAFVAAVRDLIRRDIAPQLAARGQAFLKVITSSAAWEQPVGSIFGTAELVSRERVLHALDTLALPAWRASMPDGYFVRQVDAELLRNSRLRGITDLRNEIMTGWPSLAGFLNGGFGFCLLHGDEIVTWCTAEYMSRGKCGVGIETAVEHMRRGFATLTASALAEHALAQGLTPYWDSWKANLPSLAVARKVGFRVVSEYTIFAGRL